MCSCLDATLGNSPCSTLLPRAGAAPYQPVPPLRAGCQGGSDKLQRLKTASFPTPDCLSALPMPPQEATGKAPCCPLPPDRSSLGWKENVRCTPVMLSIQNPEVWCSQNICFLLKATGLASPPM